jgi:hypothetical protein
MFTDNSLLTHYFQINALANGIIIDFILFNKSLDQYIQELSTKSFTLD